VRASELHGRECKQLRGQLLPHPSWHPFPLVCMHAYIMHTYCCYITTRHTHNQGLEWVAQHHVKPAVVHMSIEGGFSSLVNNVVEQMLRTQHIHVIVSSGKTPPCPSIWCGIHTPVMN
jgi:hypothetical protein